MAQTRPCILIGWDGATFDLLSPWAERGLLPNLASMLSRGTARELRSIIPPVTPAAWVSILTGMNPGKHGILDFNVFSASDYSQTQRLINSTHFSGTTILDLLSERGLRVCSLQLPLTYPVWPVNGLMLGGIPNPDDSLSYVYPPDRDFGTLRPAKMRPHMPYHELFENHSFHIRKITDIFAEESKEDYDFFCIYFRECDDFHHIYWRFLDENCPGYDASEAREIGNPIKSIYMALDDALGRILAARPDANFFLISDHGATAMGRRRFYLNAWLASHGCLKLKRNLGATLMRLGYRGMQLVKPWISWYRGQRIKEKLGLGQVAARVAQGIDGIEWAESRAFAVLPCASTVGVQVNMRGREAQGIVEPGREYERLRDELIEQLGAIEDPVSGKRVVTEVDRREKFFSGPYLERIPDIVLSLATDVIPRTDIGADVWGYTRPAEFRDISGEHDMNGIFAATGPDISSEGFLSPATLLDVAPTLLYTMGLPVPGNMDGNVLEDIFQRDFKDSHVLLASDSREVATREGESVYSEDEEAAIRTRLQGLGYLDE